jgi:ABC-type sugar transport system ATPase subunit
MKPEPSEKNDAETLRWTLRGGRRQRAPKERLGTWEALTSGSQLAGFSLNREEITGVGGRQGVGRARSSEELGQLRGSEGALVNWKQSQRELDLIGR